MTNIKSNDGSGSNGSETVTPPLKHNPFAQLKGKVAVKEMSAAEKAGLLNKTEEPVTAAAPVSKPEPQVAPETTAPAASAPPAKEVAEKIKVPLFGSNLKAEQRRREELVNKVLMGQQKPVVDPESKQCSMDSTKLKSGAHFVVSSDGKICGTSEEYAKVATERYGRLTPEERMRPEAQLLLVLTKEKALHKQAEMQEMKQKEEERLEDIRKKQQAHTEQVRAWHKARCENPVAGMFVTAFPDGGFKDPASLELYENLLAGKLEGHPKPEDELDPKAAITHVVIFGTCTTESNERGLRIAFLGHENARALSRRSAGDKTAVHVWPLYTTDPRKFTLFGLNKAQQYFFPPRPPRPLTDEERKRLLPQQSSNQGNRNPQQQTAAQKPESSRDIKPGASRHQRRHNNKNKKHNQDE